MRKYLVGFMVALALIGVWETRQYIARLQTEAALAHVQAQQGAEAFKFLAAVLAQDKDGKPVLTMGDALTQMVQAQLKAAQAQQPPVAR